MNLDDLWIGDEVEIIRSGRIGKFLGTNKGKARVQIKDKVLLVLPSGVRLAPEKKFQRSAEIDSESEPKESTQKSFFQESYSFKPEIDLHIEALQPTKKNDNPVAILEFQLRKLREFLDNAVRLRAPKVHIIHGRGTGALRMETMHMIDGMPEKVSIFPTNNDGGVTVYFKY